LVALVDGWSLWSWACLRATGFPARLVLDLAGDELAAAADRLLDHEVEVARRRDASIAACKAAIDRVGPEAQRPLRSCLNPT